MQNVKRLQVPRWSGEGLEGKRILLWADMGLGDTFQLCRFASFLRDKHHTHVILEVQRELTPLLMGQWGFGVTVVGRGERRGSFDFHVPLSAFLDYPMLALNPSPYLKAPQPKRWQYFDSTPEPRVGVAWQGDQQSERGRLIGRSWHVAALAPLAEVATLICLQKDRYNIHQAYFPMVTCPLDHEAFMDTAAIMRGLDLVVTSDTAVAHLAGALGRPTWVALHETPDSRWGERSISTPLYPTMRLWRKAHGEPWYAVVERMAHAIRSEYPGGLIS